MFESYVIQTHSINHHLHGYSHMGHSVKQFHQTSDGTKTKLTLMKPTL